MLRAICPFSLSLTYVPAKITATRIEDRKISNPKRRLALPNSRFRIFVCGRNRSRRDASYRMVVSPFLFGCWECTVEDRSDWNLDGRRFGENRIRLLQFFFFFGGKISRYLLYVMFDAYWLEAWNGVVEILKQPQDIFLAEMHVHDWNLKGIFVTRSSILEQYSTCIT